MIFLVIHDYKADAEITSCFLNDIGIRANFIHEDLNRRAREYAVKNFDKEKIPILVTSRVGPLLSRCMISIAAGCGERDWNPER